MRAWLFVLAVAACGKRDGAIELARRDKVAEVAVARVNADDVLDLVVVYQPTFKDPIGKRFSTMDAYDGATGAMLWTTQLDGFVLERIIDLQRLAVTESQIVVATADLGATTDREPVLLAHDLASGRPLWKRQFTAVTQSHSFAMWRHEGLVLVNATPRASRGTSIVALEAASGQQRWVANVPVSTLGPGGPVFVDGQIVVTAEDARTLALIDPATGTVRTIACSWRVPPLATSAGLYAGIDEPEYQRALGKVDMRAGTLARVASLSSGLSVVSVGPAIYRDLVLHIDDLGLHATRIGADHLAWSLPIGSKVHWGEARTSPLAAYFRAVPARYLPFLDEPQNGKGVIHVVDLETGQDTWHSKPIALTLSRSMTSGFIVVGTHYYFDLDTADGDLLLGFDGETGKFDGAYAIRIDEMKGKPDDDSRGRPFVWHFQFGMLVGSWNNVSWMIDLAKNRLALVHPAGRATLEAAWSSVDDTLGPVPREIDLAP